MKYLACKNWRKHQHYRERNAPWIKFYAGLLEDADFLAMSETAQLQLLKIWLLASRIHPLPNNAIWIAGKIGVKKVRVSELVAAGFLYETENATEGQWEKKETGDDASTDDSKGASEIDSALTRGRGRGRGEPEELTTEHTAEGEDPSVTPIRKLA